MTITVVENQMSGDFDVWSLFDVTWLTASDGPDAYLDRVLARCANWFRAAGGSIFLNQPDGQFVLACKTGTLTDIPEGATLDSRSGIARRAIEMQLPLIVDEVSAETIRGLQLNRQDEIGSAMVVPLKSPDGILGVINLSRRRGEPAFVLNDLVQAQSIGRHLALAVSNARLFQENRQLSLQQNQLRERFSSIVHQMGVGVVVTDSDGSLSEVNPMGQMLFTSMPHLGAPADAWMKLVKPIFRKSLARMVNSSRSGRTRQFRVANSAGCQAWSLVSCPMPSGGVVLTIEDVTAHERALQEQHHTNRLAEIGQMTAAIAHEIRNPLTGIQSAAQMIVQNPEQARDFAPVVLEEASKLNHLCNDFLDFARPMQLSFEPVRLSDIATSVAHRLQSQFDEHQVSLTVESDPNARTIRGDRNRLEQVLMNLLLNALQASSRGHSVKVTATSSRLIVEDHGIGMDEDTLANLFTPFFTTKTKGTGLGLSNVKKIIEAHRGRVFVRSDLGAGTHFEVRINSRNAA